MALGGYAGRVAWIDLSRGAIEYRPIAEEHARKFIGARGMGVKYVFDNGPQVDPLSPDNILCFMNGPLTGTDANLSGRMAIVTKSPLTGTMVDSHHGGWSAARLKWAGFDGLVFRGKADHPVYAYVEDGKVTMHDASDVWGKTVHETVKVLQERHGGSKDLSVITIGVAGENLVKFASWVNEDDRASGRGGTGCVGGSKNLKAIVIRGKHENRPRPANADGFKLAQKMALAQLMDEEFTTSPRKGGLSIYGTNTLMNDTNEIGGLPTYNAKSTSFGERAELISGEHVKDTILVRDPTCHACPVACKKEVEIKEGPFKVHMESLEYEMAWSFGAMCGNDNVASVAYLIDRANDYGMDGIETGDVMALYMECTERGGNGDGLQWGDAHSMVEMVRKIAYREGIGNTLAEGTGKAAALLGHPELGMHVKGMGIPAYDPRGIKGMGIGYATSNRGACHLRGYTPASEVVGNVLYATGTSDPLAWEGKAQLAIAFQNIQCMTDCLDLCKFSTFSESLDAFAAQFAAVTGLEYTVDELVRCGERVYNLERRYNNLNGFTGKDDTLPRRFLEEPSDSAGSKGQVCELDKMLADYYQIRGWVDGVVPEAKLKELDLI